MSKQNDDFYQKLRKKIRNWVQTEDGKTNKWSEYLMAAPDLFHLLCKLSIDSKVSAKEKAKLIAAITYFVSPIDLVPELILGPVGYVDDIALAAYVLNNLINKTDSEIVKKHWAGDKDILILISNILAIADEMVGVKWKEIIKKFKNSNKK